MIGKKVDYWFFNGHGIINENRGVILDKILVRDTEHYLIDTGREINSIRCDRIVKIID